LFGSAIDHLHSLVCGHMTGGYPVYMGICKNEICPGWLLKVREHYTLMQLVERTRSMAVCK